MAMKWHFIGASLLADVFCGVVRSYLHAGDLKKNSIQKVSMIRLYHNHTLQTNPL